MKRSSLAIALLSLALAGSAFGQGPFGFERGMTREQVVKLVGSGAVVQRATHDDFLRVNTAPIPNRAFESYLLLISPTHGLVKLIATGVTVETGDTGAALMLTYDGIVSSVSRKYGEPKNSFNSCTGNDTECENAGFWMLSLKDKNRSVDSFWFLNPPLNNVVNIEVELVALSMQSGYVHVVYEFEGFHDYITTVKAKEDASY